MKSLISQVSTHGYSQNQILVWKYPSLTQVAKLTGHSYRVLYLVSVCFDDSATPLFNILTENKHLSKHQEYIY